MGRRVIWLCAFFFVVLNSSMPAQQTVTVTASSPSPNIVLVSPQDPTFDAIARRLLGAAASGPALDLKPFLVIVSNRSTDTVVAYQLLWKITHTNQTVEYHYTNFNDPDGVMPAILATRDEQPLARGDERLVGREFQLDPSWTAANVQGVLLGTIQDQQAKMPRIERLDISLNAVIFADGLLVGPDTQDFSKIFAIYVDEKQKWLRQVVGDLDAGRSINEAFETMSQVRQQVPPILPNLDWSAYYRREAAAEIFNLRKRIGDDAVSSVFRKAIRAEPFVIRRSP
jgi:hypothetical protein